MLKKILLFLFLLPVICMAQRVQRVKGTVVDKESKTPLTGVSVGITDISPVLGTVTDLDGNFVIDSVPVGKHIITISYVGYQGSTMTDVLVTSAKEVSLPMELEERAVKINEVVISQRRDHINEMALVSVKTFDVQETERYAGSRSDPARMASNFAGVQGGDDSRNDIVIRGNSPQGVLWRLEGVDIPNPNHFNIPGTTGGPVSMLNSKTLANSDFFMGAFPAEYGDAIAGVFDLRLRNGNSDKFEFTGQFGFLGTELAAEGPLGKNGSSFLLTYRYSTLALFQGLHIKIGTTSVPHYQDATFKLNFPISKKSNISLFGIGGLSNIDLIVSTLTTPPTELYGESDRDQHFISNTGILGATYSHTIDQNTFTKVTVAQTASDVLSNHSFVFRDSASYHLDSLKNILGYRFLTATTVAHWSLTKKLSSQQTIKLGIVNNYYHLNLIDSSRQYPINQQTWQHREDFNGGTDLVQAYVQYKYRPSDKLTLTGGIHAQYLTHNQSKSLEPRIGMRWAPDAVNSLTAGYGLHSQMLQLYQYFAIDTNNKMLNNNVGFMRSHHFIAGYDRVLTKELRLKLETYYQYLFDVPVETRAGSSYSALNKGSGYSRDFPGALQNTGTGYNYGVELTLEKRFSHGYYVLLSGSLFDSKAKGNDGVYRNTDYNSHFATNLLGGYEHKLGTYSTLTTGIKVTYIGGKLYSPFDSTLSKVYNDAIIADNQRNTLQFKDYFRADVKLGVRFNSKKVTHELALDLVNVFNTQNILSATYSYGLAQQGKNPFYYQYQLGFLPIFYYRLDFGIKRK
jgi:hypothetical protein